MEEEKVIENEEEKVVKNEEEVVENEQEFIQVVGDTEEVTCEVEEEVE